MVVHASCKEGMNKLEKSILALRFQLDKLETLVERQSGKKTAHHRIGAARQGTTGAELRKGRIGKRRRKPHSMR